MIRVLPRTAVLRRRGHGAGLLIAVLAGFAVASGVLAFLDPARRPPLRGPPPLAAIAVMPHPEPAPPPEAGPSPADGMAMDGPAPAETARLPLPELDLPLSPPSALAPILPPLPACDPAPLAERPPSWMDSGSAPAMPGPASTAPAVGSGPPDRPPGLVCAFDLQRFFPSTARQRGITGTSRIRIAVDAAGRPTSCAIVSSIPAGVFDAAAELVGMSLRFDPAIRGGRPVPARIEYLLAWRLER